MNAAPTEFSRPVKRITTEEGMDQFRSSVAYTLLSGLIESVSHHVNGQTIPQPDYELRGPPKIIVDALHSLYTLSTNIELSSVPQRFGNVAFREWHRQAVEQIPTLFHKIGNSDAWIELDEYLFDSFGSAERLDYGSGHELNFFAFLGGLLSLNLWDTKSGRDVLFVFSEYYRLIRHLIQRFNLEPAGSHGVWGLDDHFHLLFIFGAAQLAHGADNGLLPKDVTNERVLEAQRELNLYFGEIAFIMSVKRGNFFEHSPMLHDISGVVSWTKVYRGMLKMYKDVVLGKLPVMQHFKFGAIYPFDQKSSQALG